MSDARMAPAPKPAVQQKTDAQPAANTGTTATVNATVLDKSSGTADNQMVSDRQNLQRGMAPAGPVFLTEETKADQKAERLEFIRRNYDPSVMKDAYYAMSMLGDKAEQKAIQRMDPVHGAQVQEAIHIYRRGLVPDRLAEQGREFDKEPRERISGKALDEYIKQKYEGYGNLKDLEFLARRANLQPESERAAFVSKLAADRRVSPDQARAVEEIARLRDTKIVWGADTGIAQAIDYKHNPKSFVKDHPEKVDKVVLNEPTRGERKLEREQFVAKEYSPEVLAQARHYLSNPLSRKSFLGMFNAEHRQEILDAAETLKKGQVASDKAQEGAAHNETLRVKLSHRETDAFVKERFGNLPTHSLERLEDAAKAYNKAYKKSAVKGEEYLDSLPPNIREDVKFLAEIRRSGVVEPRTLQDSQLIEGVVKSRGR